MSSSMLRLSRSAEKSSPSANSSSLHPSSSDTTRNVSISREIHIANNTILFDGDSKISHLHGILSKDEGAGGKWGVVGDLTSFRPSAVDEPRQKDSAEDPSPDNAHVLAGTTANPHVSYPIPVVRSTVEALSITDCVGDGELPVSRPSPAMLTGILTDIQQEPSICQIIATVEVSGRIRPSAPQGSKSARGIVAGAIPGMKMVLEVVKEGSSEYVYFNTVAGGISAILERKSSNKHYVQKLISRIETSLESLSENCDEKKKERNITLKTKLDGPLALDLINRQVLLSAFLKNADQAGGISGTVKDIGDAVTDYQIAVQHAIYPTLEEPGIRFVDHIGSFDEGVSGDITWKFDRLLHAKDAACSVGDRNRCPDNRRIKLLQAIEARVQSPNPLRIYRLDGLAGTKKSTIAQTTADRLGGTLNPQVSCHITSVE